MFSRKAKALLLGDVIWFFGEGMLGPLFAVFSERVGGDVLDISWAWAIYLLVTGTLMICVGRLSDDRMTKERLVIAGYVLNTICTFAYLFVSDSKHLFILQAGLGVAAALATPTWNALYAKSGRMSNDGSQWGIADGMSSICTGVAVIVGGLVVAYSSFTVLFVIMGSVQLTATLVLLPILKAD